MESKMIFAYLIHLSDNMWGDIPKDNADVPGSGYSQELYADYDTWRQLIDFLPAQGFNTVVIDLGDAVQYESHPEIAIKGAWSKDFLKQELEHMRSIGLTPIPKLNFSACHDAWMGIYSRMLCTPTYYQVCEDLIKEVAELFGYPALFHLGMDEENQSMQRNFEFCCIRQHDLWWRDLYFYFDVCQKVGTRPWVWADACWTYFGKQEEYLTKMPKSVLQSNWWYKPLERNKDGQIEDFRYQGYFALDRAGFDQVPTVSTIWGCVNNAQQTMELARQELNPALIKGFMTAPWRFTFPENIFDLKNDAFRFGLGKKAIYPELG